MTKEEFNRLNGPMFEDLVATIQNDTQFPLRDRENVYDFLHENIKDFIKNLGLTAIGLIKAEEEWASKTRNESWQILLLRTFFQPGSLDRLLQQQTEIS